jgi:hypothetical protein
MRRIPENREEYFDARNDAYFMPDTYRQGWGQITGQKTQVTITEQNGVRTITRTDA